MAGKRVTRKRASRRIAGLPAWLVIVPVLLLAAMAAGALWLSTVWSRPAPADAKPVEIGIPEGASLRQISGILERAGLVPDARLFEAAARALGGDRAPQTGTYAFRKGEGWGVMLDRMQRGDVVTIAIAIPEGMPSIMVAERLRAQERLTGAMETPAEGSVLPATYSVKPGEARAAVLRRMQKEMQATLDRLWPARSPDAVVKTPAEAVTLASIVEKESAIPAERKRVAGLYSNRLRKGMRLEADPTVIYPVTKGKPLGRRIRRSELAADTGYNTYLKAGLPAGPITNPGADSIEAVLHPERNDYLFMVADGKGGHVFAKDFAEHRRNVEKWYGIRKDRGEM